MPLSLSFSRFNRARGGNVALLFALILVPLLFLAGMAIDYALAAQRRSQLQSIADAAALSAVSLTSMSQSAASAQTAATSLFNAQAAKVTGIVLSAPSVTVTQTGLARTATVSFSASSNNAFVGIIGQNLWPISGISTAAATAAPNIDFYLLLDNSPSMAIAATTAGINTMIANTKAQDNGNGCAFACHQSNTSGSDTAGNPPGLDNYALAKQLGVVTRIQNVATAAKSLASTAASTASSKGSTYRMAGYTFTSNNLGSGLVAVQSLTSNLTTAGNAVGAVDVLKVCKNNYTSCSTYDDDTNTDFDYAMSRMNSIMPTPGTGAQTSSPKEVLFIVTDGVDDMKSNSCAYPTIVLSGFQRCMQPVDISTCATIKQRGIQIAILYTEYYPLPTNGFYNQYIAPFQSQIGPNLQNCASPGLFFTVTTSQDISSAMTALFQAAVASISAHIAN